MKIYANIRKTAKNATYGMKIATNADKTAAYLCKHRMCGKNGRI